MVIRVENGNSTVDVDEAVLFPFDDYNIPFTRGLLLSLVPGSKRAGEYLTGSCYDPDHPGRPVVALGPSDAPDSREVICPTVVRIENEYRMWYICRGELEASQESERYGARPMEAQRRMAHAVSKDGLN